MPKTTRFPQSESIDCGKRVVFWISFRISFWISGSVFVPTRDHPGTKSEKVGLYQYGHKMGKQTIFRASEMGVCRGEERGVPVFKLQKTRG